MSDALTAPVVERHVRVCPQHGVEIQEGASGRLVCPKGWHPVVKFRVVDRLKGSVQEASVDGVGVKEMTTPKPVAVASPPRGVGQKTQALATAKFVDPQDTVLYLRLVRHRTARSGDLFVVRWSRASGGKVETGVLAQEAFAETARTVYAEALKQAKVDGWTERPLLAHTPRFAPLPKPAKKTR